MTTITCTTRTGSKVHLASPTSTVTHCGIWLKVSSSSYAIDAPATCAHCTGDSADATPVAAAPATDAPAKCANSGVISNAGRGSLYGKCTDCGKAGKVGRTNRLRAHAPHAA